MNAVLARLWPRSLAVRLTVLMIVALGLAQAALAVVLSSQRDTLVEDLMHSQALNQTVTLARLLNAYPQDEDGRLTAAFASRQSCAVVEDEPPKPLAMTAQERQLAGALEGMLHGIKAGAPQVAFEAGVPSPKGCTGFERLDGDEDEEAEEMARYRGGFEENEAAEVNQRFTALAMDVPLLDGRWLHVRTAIDLPEALNDTTLLSFLLSAAAVAIVAIVGVRTQTRSLRKLADASERFGRGEQVASLPENGPSEVGAATQAFNLMQQRLSQFIAERMRLLASVSHDLRTPLTTLRLKAELIDDEATRDDLVATIDELTVICEATLAFTRSEAASEPSVAVDLGRLVHEVAEGFELAGAPVSEQASETVRCTCRPVALKRAVRNLIENAVRYGHAARTSVVADSSQAVIAIEDDGPGIPASRIDEAFQPFVRLETSRNPETGGIGLGLSIARGIVSAHGGTLTLNNLAAGGLRAEIRLPL